MDSAEAYHIGVSDGKQDCVRIAQNTPTRRLLGARVLEDRAEDRRLQPLIGLPVFQVVQRPAAERRKARSEDEARVGEIGVGDDALGDDGLRLLEIRPDQFLAQIGSRAAGPAFARLAVFPGVKAAAGFPAEGPRGDERGELLRRLGSPPRPLPAARDGFLKFARMSASLRLEVFEARIAPGFAAASSLANSSRLACKFSKIASMTTSA